MAMKDTSESVKKTAALAIEQMEERLMSRAA